MRRCIPLLVILLLTALTGCSDNPVGRKCFIGTPPDNNNQPIITSPALECPSRTCLHMPLQSDQQSDLCTAECNSDADCDKVPESPCASGFACAIPVVVGPFCCRKECICRDYLVIPDGGVPDPVACDPTRPENTCVNLPGRGV